MAVKQTIDFLECCSDRSRLPGASSAKEKNAQRLHVDELFDVTVADHSLDIIQNDLHEEQLVVVLQAIFV